jgi:hypothetical protein
MTRSPDSSPPRSPDPEIPLYDQLRFYTLAHGGAEFIHQYVVDAWTAQHADEHTKSIAITFALVGLYLCVEKHYSGRHVQQVHMQMAKRRKDWPTFPLPTDRGSVTVTDVMNAPAGPERDQAILRWCESVWHSWSENGPQIAKLLSNLQILE